MWGYSESASENTLPGCEAPFYVLTTLSAYNLPSSLRARRTCSSKNRGRASPVNNNKAWGPQANNTSEPFLSKHLPGCAAPFYVSLPAKQQSLCPCYGPLFLSRALEKGDHNMGATKPEVPRPGIGNKIRK